MDRLGLRVARGPEYAAGAVLTKEASAYTLGATGILLADGRCGIAPKP